MKEACDLTAKGKILKREEEDSRGLSAKKIKSIREIDNDKEVFTFRDNDYSYLLIK